MFSPLLFIECIDDCLRCADDSSCLECQDGFYLETGLRTCTRKVIIETIDTCKVFVLDSIFISF